MKKMFTRDELWQDDTAFAAYCMSQGLKVSFVRCQ